MVRRNPVRSGADLPGRSMWSVGLRQARFKSWFHGFLGMLFFDS